jgi:FkbM family methyltransferase
MLISLDLLIQKYKVIIKGILHVGAHECEELRAYLNYVSMDKILWIEAMPDKVALSKQLFPGIIIENAIVSDVVETVQFNVSNNGQSSSFLDLGLHSYFHPDVHYVDSFKGTTKLLRDILPKYDIDFNFLNFDIQGTELKALKGMKNYLFNVDYVYIEVNADYIYKNCALVNEIDDFLLRFGLHRVETVWCGDCRWGDAFYIRK